MRLLVQVQRGTVHNLENKREVGGMFKWEWTWVNLYWFMLMLGRIQHNTVKQLSFDYKFDKGIWLLVEEGWKIQYYGSLIHCSQMIGLDSHGDGQKWIIFSFGEQKSIGFSDGLWKKWERSVLEMTPKFCLSRFVIPLTEIKPGWGQR